MLSSFIVYSLDNIITSLRTALMAHRAQHYHSDPSRVASQRRPATSVFQLSKLSLEDIVALSYEGMSRLGHLPSTNTIHVTAVQERGADANNGGASPLAPNHQDAPGSHRHHSRGTAHHHRSPTKTKIAVYSSPQRDDSRNAPKPSNGDQPKHTTGSPHRGEGRQRRDASQPPAHTSHYVSELERAVGSADARHQAICRVLYDSVAHLQRMEAINEEERARRTLEAACDHDMLVWWRHMSSELHLDMARTSRKLRAAQQDRASIMDTTNAVVSTTAQSYVLNDLKKVLQDQHNTSQQAIATLDTRLKTMIETHATTLHMAIGQSKESISSLQGPIEGRMRQLEVALGLVAETVRRAVDDKDASTNGSFAALQESLLSLTLGVGEVSGLLRTIDQRTSDLDSAASEHRRVIFEDLARRAAADTKRWDEHRAATEAMIGSLLQASQASTDAVARSSQDALVESIKPISGGVEAVRVAVDHVAVALHGHHQKQAVLHDAVTVIPESTASAVKTALTGNFQSLEGVLAEVLDLQRQQAARAAAAAALPQVTHPPPPTAVLTALDAYLTIWTEASTQLAAAVVEPFARLASTSLDAAKAAAMVPPPAVVSPLPAGGNDGEQQRLRAATLEAQVAELNAKLAAVDARERAKVSAYAEVAQPFIPNQEILKGVIYVAPQPREVLHRICGLTQSDPAPPPAASHPQQQPLNTHTAAANVAAAASSPAAGPVVAAFDGTDSSPNTAIARRRVSRDLIVPFSPVPADAASTAQEEGEDRTNVTERTVDYGGRATTDPSPMSPLMEDDRSMGRVAVRMVLSSDGSDEMRQSPGSGQMIDFTFGGASGTPAAASPIGRAVVSPPLLAASVDPPPLAATIGPNNYVVATRASATPVHQPIAEVRQQDALSSPSVSDGSDISLTSIDEDGGDDNVPPPAVASRAHATNTTVKSNALLQPMPSKLLNSFDVDDDERDEPVAAPAARAGPASPAPTEDDINALAPTHHTPPRTAATTTSSQGGIGAKQAAVASSAAPAQASAASENKDDALLTLRPGRGAGKKSLPTW